MTSERLGRCRFVIGAKNRTRNTLNRLGLEFNLIPIRQFFRARYCGHLFSRSVQLWTHMGLGGRLSYCMGEVKWGEFRFIPGLLQAVNWWCFLTEVLPLGLDEEACP